MKIAYSNLASPEWSMGQVFTFAAEYGFDGVEIRLVDGEVIRSDIDTTKQSEMLNFSRETGVEIVGLGASTRFATSDANLRRENVDELVKYIELAANMGVPMVRTFGGGLSHQGELLSQDRVLFVAEALNQVAARAEELGVKVLLETHDDFSSSAMVRDVLRQVSSEAVGALWDTHHPYRMNETVAETYTNLKDRLQHVHLKDAKRNGDDWDLVVFGAGEVPVRDIVRTLIDSGYDAYLCVEWEKKWHPEIEPAETALPKHLSILRGYLS